MGNLKLFKLRLSVFSFVSCGLFLGQSSFANECQTLRFENSFSMMISVEPGKSSKELGLNQYYDATPKDWNASDRSDLKNSFRDAWSYPRFRRVACFIYAKIGKINLGRYNQLKLYPDSAIWNYQKINLFGVGDRFLSIRNKTPKLATRILVHEYLHKLDETLGVLSWQESYWNLLKFHYIEGKKTGEEGSWSNGHISRDTYLSHKKDDQYIQNYFGFPTWYSLYNPIESFAELGSFTIVEPNELAFVPEEITSYFIKLIDSL